MKLKTLIAASALGSTGVIGAVSNSASAICGVELEVQNINVSDDVTVDWADSSVRRRQNVGGVLIPGPWTTLGNYATVVGAGDTVNNAFFLPGSCGFDYQYRLELSSARVTNLFHYPGLATWTQDRTPHIYVA